MARATNRGFDTGEDTPGVGDTIPRLGQEMVRGLLDSGRCGRHDCPRVAATHNIARRDEDLGKGEKTNLECPSRIACRGLPSG